MLCVADQSDSELTASGVDDPTEPGRIIVGAVCDVQARAGRRRVHVWLHGELCAYGSPRLETSLLPLAASADRLVLGLAELRFIDSAGVRLLGMLRDQVTARGGTCRIEQARPTVARAVELALPAAGSSVSQSAVADPRTARARVLGASNEPRHAPAGRRRRRR